MPTVRGSGLLRDIATIRCAGGPLRQRGRYRREAIDLVEREDLLAAAYCHRSFHWTSRRATCCGPAVRRWMPCKISSGAENARHDIRF